MCSNGRQRTGGSCCVCVAAATGGRGRVGAVVCVAAATGGR